MAKITLHGNTFNTISDLPAVGTTMNDFTLVNEKLEDISLSHFDRKRKVLNIFPSIDTGTCAASARQFNEKATFLQNTEVINISKDLPFALHRFCAAEGLEDVTSLSDFRGTFGEDVGVQIADGPMRGLLSRAVIILNESNEVIYTEQVSELANEPNYDAALEALS